MPEMAAGLADHGAQLEVDGLEMRIDTAAAFRGQGVDELIAPHITIGLRLDHSSFIDRP
ncbi:hypothetical protein LQG66_30140 [Bradyrhizobium ontarionense]|uniref:Uncharacterized protein n=1 Tax=Bradyrhizobium ontarionense TaxID=2898149 RepID=A0ABY3R812_9BRAD|nr:hypothetical protein [Bradyrhizobium sp. A19]UFZ03443.1 hypothetical protein LQG66_30140 [Bradyrhizobium sp. A19]